MTRWGILWNMVGGLLMAAAFWAVLWIVLSLPIAGVGVYGG